MGRWDSRSQPVCGKVLVVAVGGDATSYQELATSDHDFGEIERRFDSEAEENVCVCESVEGWERVDDLGECVGGGVSEACWGECGGEAVLAQVDG